MIRKRLRQRTVDQEGFTIVELMIATMVFSVIMLVAAGTVVRFTNNFQRGLSQTTTQATARSVIESISQSLQFGGGYVPLTESGGSKGYCVGTKRYSYRIGAQLQGDKPVFTEEGVSMAGCNGVATNLTNVSGLEDELLAPGMRLLRLEIGDSPGGTNNVIIRVAYGDNDLFCSEDVTGSCTGNGELSQAQIIEHANTLQCKGQKGSQYCAVSELRTSVKSRK